MIRNLLVLNFAEMFERLTYYGVRSIMILYLVNEISVDREHIADYYGNFTIAIYIIGIFSGLISDISRKPALIALFGNFLTTIGIFTFAASHSQSSALAGMALIALGVGTFKPAIVGSLFRSSFNVKQRLDLILTIFYAAINLGAFLGPLLIGSSFVTNATINFRTALTVAGCLSLIPTILLAINYKHLSINDIIYDKQSFTLSSFNIPKVAIYFVLTIIFWLVYELVPLVTGADSDSSFQIVAAISGLVFLLIMIPLNVIPNFRSALKIILGLILAGIACFVTQLLVDNPIVVILVFALSEALIYPVVMSQIMLNVSLRFTATFIALFMALSLLTNTLAGAIVNSSENGQISMLYLFGTVLLGLVIALLAIDSKEKNPENPSTRL